MTPVGSGPRINPAEIAAQIDLAELIVYELSDVPGQIVVPAEQRPWKTLGEELLGTERG